MVCLVTTLGEAIGLGGTPQPPECCRTTTVATSQYQQIKRSMDALWIHIIQCITSNHKPPYSARLLALLIPLLQVG